MIAWPPLLPVWLVGLRFGVGLVAAPYLRLLEVLLAVWLAEGRTLGLTVT